MQEITIESLKNIDMLPQILGYSIAAVFALIAWTMWTLD